MGAVFRMMAGRLCGWQARRTMRRASALLDASRWWTALAARLDPARRRR